MASNRLMMMVAVIAGLLSTALAFLYLTQTRASIENQSTERSERVLVATRDLNANSVIIPDEDFSVKEIPAETFRYLAGAAVNSSERNALEGRRINAPIPAGTPLLYSHLTEVVDLTISPAARAMTIPVDDAAALGGLLVPGDRVDIVVTRRYVPPADNFASPDPVAFDAANPDASIGAVLGQMMSQTMGQENNAEYIADIVLSNIRVIAVGQNLSLSRQQFVFAPDSAASRSRRDGAKTVTFELTPEQALTLASSVGGGASVTLLLRGKEAGESTRGFESGFN